MHLAVVAIDGRFWTISISGTPTLVTSHNHTCLFLLAVVTFPPLRQPSEAGILDLATPEAIVDGRLRPSVQNKQKSKVSSLSK